MKSGLEFQQNITVFQHSLVLDCCPLVTQKYSFPYCHLSLKEKKKKILNMSWYHSVLMCLEVRSPTTWWIRVQCRGRAASWSFLGQNSH